MYCQIEGGLRLGTEYHDREIDFSLSLSCNVAVRD